MVLKLYKDEEGDVEPSTRSPALMLILDLCPYIDELSKTGGAIKEFVNPKYNYKDSTKTAFKSSTRLECMMQDYPKTLPPSARVGFTVTETWLAYAPVKNNPEDAAKVPKGNPYHSATSGEMAIYRENSMILRKESRLECLVQFAWGGGGCRRMRGVLLGCVRWARCGRVGLKPAGKSTHEGFLA